MTQNFLCVLVRVYFYTLLARVILSFVPMFRPDWTPPGGLRPVVDLIHLLTDPPVDFLRRFIPPIRSGAMAIDLAFLAWFLIFQLAIAPVLC